MVRLLSVSLLLALLGGAAMAQDTHLKRLETGEDSRGWEGVGRLDIDGKGFCTGALIAPDLVLTAAHCLFDKHSGARIDHAKIEFLAGWRNGRASAYRWVRNVAVHPDYVYDRDAFVAMRAQNDVALLELHHPIRNTTITPFETDAQPEEGERIGVVSYAHDRSEAPSMQEECHVLARQQGVLVMSCDIDFGSSGAPVFAFSGGVPRIVSVVSAKGEMGDSPVSLGSRLQESLERLKADLAAGGGAFARPGGLAVKRVMVGGVRGETGAKFVKP